MMVEFPDDQGWWEALAFRLSGPENALVRALIAGNPGLPPAAFAVLAQDAALEVLAVLSRHPAVPEPVALSLLKHPDAGEFLTTEWFDAAPSRYSGMGGGDFYAVLEGCSSVGVEAVLLHANTDDHTAEEALRQYGRIEDQHLVSKLLLRYPHEQPPRLWGQVLEDHASMRTVICCPGTPLPLLLLVAQEQWRLMHVNDGWDYEHEVTEELFRHPNASAELFELFLDHDVFQEKEYDGGGECVATLLEYPNATARQRRRVARLNPQQEE